MWAVVLAAISLFLASLTGRRAFATGAVAIFFLLTFTLAEILLQVEGTSAPQTTRPGQLGQLPVAPRGHRGEGVRPVQPVHPVRRGAHVAGRHQPRPTACPTPAASASSTPSSSSIITGLCLAGLAARYRKARLS